MLVTNKDDIFEMESEDVRLVHIEMKPMIESFAYWFYETTLNHANWSIVRTNVAGLFEIYNHDGQKGEKMPVYQAF